MVAPACGQQRWSLFFFERTTVMSFTEGCFYRTYVFAFTGETPVSHDSCCEADGLHLLGVAAEDTNPKCGGCMFLKSYGVRMSVGWAWLTLVWLRWGHLVWGGLGWAAGSLPRVLVTP